MSQQRIDQVIWVLTFMATCGVVFVYVKLHLIILIASAPFKSREQNMLDLEHFMLDLGDRAGDLPEF